jgi:hypothetical protein
MSNTYYVLSDNVLGMKSTIGPFQWSFGWGCREATVEDYLACGTKVVVDSEDREEKPFARGQDYHHFKGLGEGDVVTYDRRILLRRRIRLKLSGLRDATPTMRVNADYLRFVRHRFMNLHSAGYILTDATVAALLMRGLSTIHASAVGLEAGVLTIVAPPNTGKTLTALQMCRDHGAEFMSEDLVISDGDLIHAVPWTSTFRYYPELTSDIGAKLRRGLVKLSPVLELLPVGKPDQIESVLPSARIKAHGPSKWIVFLENAPEGVRELSFDEAARKCMNLNRYEFKYTRSPALIAYEYFNSDFSLEALYATEQRIIRKLLTEADAVLAVSALNPTRFSSLIAEALGGAVAQVA